jgi:FkbM family methyltransferase
MRVPWRRTAPELADLVGQIPPRSVAVDCGANVGDVTMALVRRCSEVVAFEPNPTAFAVLERRLGDERNVRLVQAAVGASAGVRRLFLHVDHDGDPVGASSGSSLHPTKRNVSKDRWVDVEVVDLDAFLDTLDRPVDLLKLDIEGSEIEVLERLLETGRLRAIGRVVVEMHDGVIPELAERGARLRKALSARDYTHVTLDWR